MAALSPLWRKSRGRFLECFQARTCGYELPSPFLPTGTLSISALDQSSICPYHYRQNMSGESKESTGEKEKRGGNSSSTELNSEIRKVCKEIGRSLARIGDELDEAPRRARNGHRRAPNSCNRSNLKGDKRRTNSKNIL